MIPIENLESDIGQITESVFITMLGMEVARTSDMAIGDVARATGIVTISGAWNGAIVVCVSMTLAKTIASTMFGLDEGAATSVEVNDAIGEVANMIGGNFKSMLPTPVQLSLPTVVMGRDFQAELPGCESIGNYTFMTGSDPLVIHVLSRK